MKGVPVFTINSFRKANHKTLKDLASENGGHYLNLHRTEVNDNIQFMLEEIPDRISYKNNLFDTESRLQIYGIVYSEKEPVNGALIKVKGTFEETLTNSEGAYIISASDGDKLEIEALNYKAKDTLVSGIKNMNIPLSPSGILLDSAIIKQKAQKTETVNTAFGKKNRDAVGYSLGVTFTADDILPHYRTLGDILQRMPQIIVDRPLLGDNETYRITQISKKYFPKWRKNLSCHCLRRNTI